VYVFYVICFVCQYISQVIGWEDYTLVISFVSKGFPYKDQIERVICCNGLLYVFPTCNIVNCVINFTFLIVTYFSKAQFSLFVLKVPLNPNQSLLCGNGLSIGHSASLRLWC